MSELKPCPFCGETVGTVYSIFDLEEFSEDEIAGYPHGEAFAVVCDANKKGCGASGEYAQTKEDAAEKWNRRTELITSPKRTCKTCEHNKQNSCSHLYCQHGEDWTPKKETR